MRASYIRLGAFYLYYAILLLRYFCPNFYLFIFLTISMCGRGGLNKNKAKNMQTKRRSLKNTVAKRERKNNNKKRSINVIYLLCNPNRCARWGSHVCVCVFGVCEWVCDIVLPRHLQAAQSQSQAACGRGWCCR